MLRLVPARFRRWRLLAPLCLSALLAGCLALPQTGLFAFRLPVIQTPSSLSLARARARLVTW